MTPKQAIYPLNYLSPLLLGNPQGRECRFVEEFSKFLAFQGPAIPVGRARSGIYLLVKALIRPGACQVFLSPHTIPDVVNMVLFAGGEPVFIDHLPRSTNVDLDKLEDAITEKTACVMVTHYHVNQAEFPRLQELCREKAIGLIEDCAISLGGTIDGKSVGTDSDGGVFSLSSFKFLNYFWGGVVTSANQMIGGKVTAEVAKWRRFTSKDYRAQMLRTLRYDIATRPGIFDFITAPLLRRRQLNSPNTPQVVPQPRLESVTLDSTLVSRPGAAALGEWVKKLPLVADKLAHRRNIASIYHQDLKGAMLSGESSSQVIAESCFVNYPLWVGKERRTKIYKELILSGYDVGLNLYPNVHEHPNFNKFSGRSENVAELAASTIFLPTHPRVTPEYARRLATAVKALL